MTAQEQPRGATPRLRSGAAAGRSYPTSEVRGSGWQELPHVRGQGWQPRGATPCPRLGVVAERSYATSEARGVARRIYPMPEAAARIISFRISFCTKRRILFKKLGCCLPHYSSKLRTRRALDRRAPTLISLLTLQGQNTRMGSHFLLQVIFPTQGSNPVLPH